MIREQFSILSVDPGTGKGRIEQIDGRDQVAGGSGLAALLSSRFGVADQPWNAEGQPVIFAIAQLTGYFPLMSKTVCPFKSGCHNQYSESHVWHLPGRSRQGRSEGPSAGR